MREYLRRLAGQPADREPVLSFGAWDDLPQPDPGTIVVCHPDWRGVRTAAYSFREPVVETDDLGRWGHTLIAEMAARDVEVVVLHAFPPGSAGFLEAAARAGIGTRVVLHSSMAQHGAEAGEARTAADVLRLTRDGVVDRLGFVKEGLAESFAALGYPVTYVPNRAPRLPALSPRDLGPGLHVGVFGEPFWRKNVVTQLGAVALLDDAMAHVMRRPDVDYLSELSMVEHGELPWAEFIALQASTNLNLYVTLSECYPLSPVESYLSGIPALASRTSSVFHDDPRLWELTTVEVPDDPAAIAAAAVRLLEHRGEAVERAERWIENADQDAAARWGAFVGGA